MRPRFSSKIARLAIVNLAIACQIASAPAQDSQNKQAGQGQSLRLKADLVQLRAVVVDRKGKLVDDLKKQDFEVLENGVPQQIAFFSVERAIQSGAGPNRPPVPAISTAPATEPARTMALFVDNLHLSFFSLGRAKQQLKRFIDEQITDQDLVAVVATSGTLGILQQFMKDRKRLKYAIDRISHTNLTESHFTPYIAARVLGGDPAAIGVAIQIVVAEEGYIRMQPAADQAYVEARANQILGEAANLRRASLLTLKAVSERLAEMPGQRIIALVSDGFSLLEGGGGADNMDLQAVTGGASRSGVVIYTFDAKGLEVPAEFSASTSLSGPAFSAYMAESRLDRQAVLKTVADQTGGEASVNHNDMITPLQTMLDNNRVYYSIAYYPPEADTHNKLRKIAVRVKDHPDYVVRAQKGYLPLEEKRQEVAATPREKLFQTMIAPLSASAIPVSSSTDFLARDADDAQVTFRAHIDGNSLRYQKQCDDYLLNCELEVVVFDSSGKISTSFGDTVSSTLTSDQLARAKQNGYLYTRRVSLKPGLYQLRVGVREVDSELIGTSVSWVEVPDLAKHKIALSGIFLAKLPIKRQSQVNGKPDSEAPRPEPISGAASFRPGQSASYRFVVYNAGAETGADPPTIVKLEILRGETPVYTTSEALALRTIRRDPKGIEAGGQLNLGLDSGIYTLRITVKDGKSKKSAQQTVDFEIE